MDLKRWQEVKQLVQELLDLPSEEQAVRLQEATAEDEELRRQVQGLLSVSTAQVRALEGYQPHPGSLHQIPFKAGDHVGHYLLDRVLGIGGMGIVFLAKDNDTSRQVALKIISLQAAQISTREHEVLARLNQPNIATLYDTGLTEGGYRWFAMEYVDGLAIIDYADQHCATIKSRLELFQKVCDAVKYAHKHFVAHRDLTPNNILVTADGEPKLLDFGIAKLLSTDSGQLTVTALHDRALTIAFASPEQLVGGETTTATDIYSLGVILCQLLSGQLPYPAAETLFELAWAIRNVEPERPSSLVVFRKPSLEVGDGSTSPKPISPLPLDEKTRELQRQLRGDLDAIVLRAIRKEPNRRYSSVQEFSEDVSRHLNHVPVLARQGSAAYRAGRLLRRHWVASTAATVVVLTITGALVQGFLQHNRVVVARNRAEAVSGFLMDILARSDPTQGGGEKVTVDRLLKQSEVELRYSLREQPALRADLCLTLAEIYINIGLYQEATSLLKEVLAFLPDSPDTALLRHSAYIALAHATSYYADLPVAESYAEKAQALLTRYDLGISARRRTLSLWGVLKTRRGDFRAAEKFSSQALALLEKEDEPLETKAHELYNLGIVASDAGNYPAAENFYGKAKELLLEAYPPIHPAIARLLLSRGILFMRAGKTEQAVADLQESLRQKRLLFGERHLEVGRTLSVLGGVRSNAGDFEKAEADLRLALAITSETEGAESEVAGVILNNLSNLLQETGRREEAEAALRRAVAISERVHGEHPYVADMLNNLAVLVGELGRLDEAMALHQRALRIREKTLGADSAAVGESLSNIAWIHDDQRDFGEAERLHRKAIGIKEKALGRDHLTVIISIANLAGVLREQGRLAESESLLREAEDRLLNGGNGSHYFLGVLRNHQARNACAQGDYALGRRHATEGLKIISGQLPPGAPLVVAIRATLAESLIGLGDFQAAEKQLLQGWEEALKLEPSPARLTRRCGTLLERLYTSWGKPREADKYRHRRTR